MPDKNAAAQRVIANAQIFDQLGYNVIFLNYSDEVTKPWLTNYFGFECFECPQEEWAVASRIDIDRIEEILAARADISMVVAYNYPALTLIKLKKLCKRKGLACVGDVTEWYRARDVSLVKRPFKFVDTLLRMRYINKRLDGLIVISTYLESYYKGKVPCILLPPLVDAETEKWRSLPPYKGSALSLVYAGRPSRTKERLDVIVNAVHEASASVSIRMEVIGITRDEYFSMYGANAPSGENVVFCGRLPHADALDKVSSATYSIVIRDNNRVTKAGFPTKFAESITCGTPVICNDNSDLKYWIDRYKCGVLVEESNLGEALVAISELRRPKVDRSLFDYRRYVQPMSAFLSAIIQSKENDD